MVDAVIVGAGPAGGMAARAIIEAGYRVVLLDRRRQVGVPVQCAEGLSSKALELNGLREDDEWISRRIRGVKLRFPGNTWCYITRATGYSVYREKFDQWLVKGAVDQGTELRLRTAYQGMKSSDDTWSVKTNRGNLPASIVIGADGPNSTVAMTMTWAKRREWLNTVEYRFREEDLDYPDDEYLNLYASSRYRGGYAWVFPRDGGYNVGASCPSSAKEMALEFCAQLGAETEKAIGVIGGLIPHGYEMTHYAENGVAIAGDAAGLPNPLCGGGIHAALYSGRVAGEWAVRALEAETPQLFDGYERELMASPFLDPVLWEASSFTSDLDEETLAFAGSRLNGRNLSDITWRDVGLAFLRKPRYLRDLKGILRLRRAMRLSAVYGW